MSNPGVISLTESIINGQLFKIEDNIGEAIHVHWGNFRIDLSISEFVQLVDVCRKIVEKMIDVDGFSFELYDAIFLSQRCSELIDLKKIEFKEVYISDMLIDQHDELGVRSYVGIKDSRVSKAIRGDFSELNRWKQVNYYGYDNISRLEDIQEKIRGNGYNPSHCGTYIVLNGLTNIVIDGCHRTSCIYENQGDVKLCVAKWYYKNDDRDVQTTINDSLQKHNEQIEKNAVMVSNKKKLTQYLLQCELRGKRVLLKGAGLHSEELLKIVDKSIINIVGIQDNRLTQKYWHDIPVISKENICNNNIDVILISSYYYRKEMTEEMSCYQDIDIYDIYEKGINTEFFSMLYG